MILFMLMKIPYSVIIIIFVVITGCSFLYGQSTVSSGNDYDKYYKPSQKERWYIAPAEGPVVGTQNAKYLAPQDLLTGAFRMTATVSGIQERSFELVQENCAWGKFIYQIIPVGKIIFDTASTTIPDQQKNISSHSINIEDVPKVQTNLRLSGTIRKVLNNNQSFLVDLNFADAQPVTCRIDLIKSIDVKRRPEVRGYRYGPHWKHGFDVYYPEENAVRNFFVDKLKIGE
jgi:predicted RND superfamily exporter protein